MRVCTCCEDPEVINPIEMPSNIMNQIELSNDTPVTPGGVCKLGIVSSSILIAKGLSWDKSFSMWRDQNGELIEGLLDLSK